MALLKFTRFRVLLEEWRQRYNTTHRGSDGRTAMERWEADPTPLRYLPPAMMLGMLAVQGKKHTVNKSGIRFRNADYISVALAARRKESLTVRYLPSVTEWIEVFDGNTYVGRAWRSESLPTHERTRILAERRIVEATAVALDRDARAHRTHLAKVQNDLFTGEEVLEPPHLAEVLAGRPTTRPSLPTTTPSASRIEAPEPDAARAVADLVSRIDLSHLLGSTQNHDVDGGAG